MKKVQTSAAFKGGLRYEVVNPNDLHRGKSYSDWTADWFNWFLSADADKRTSGPVVFLRSFGLPNRWTGAYTSDVPNQATGSGGSTDSMSGEIMNYSKAYINDPNVRIGGDRLQIFDNQAVFVPIMLAYWLKSEPQIDWGSMQDYTGSTIDHGDDPPLPSQLTINGEPIQLPDDIGMERFRIMTPIFPVVVPDADYGRSAKDFLEHPVSPGDYSAMVEGYFVMIRFELEDNFRDPAGCWIHSWATGPREIGGRYFAELLYQLEVHRSNNGSRARSGDAGRRMSWRPSRNERIFEQILSQKEKTGDMTDKEVEDFTKYFSSRKLYGKKKERVGVRTRIRLSKNQGPDKKIPPSTGSKKAPLSPGSGSSK